MPAGKNPELMVYQKTSSLPIDLPWTDEEDNVGFSNDGMDGPDLKLAPISAGEYISAQCKQNWLIILYAEVESVTSDVIQKRKRTRSATIEDQAAKLDPDRAGRTKSSRRRLG